MWVQNQAGHNLTPSPVIVVEFIAVDAVDLTEDAELCK